MSNNSNNIDLAPFLSRYQCDAYKFNIDGIQRLYDALDVRVPPKLDKCIVNGEVVRKQDKRKIILHKAGDGRIKAQLQNGKSCLWIGVKEVADFVPEPRPAA